MAIKTVVINKGQRGNSVLNGTIAPSTSVGINGDFYIDTVADLIYGPKASGIWGAGTPFGGGGGGPLTTDDVSEASNLYFTDSRAKSAAVADAIADSVVDVAPSQNAVFDALALKADTSALSAKASTNLSNLASPTSINQDLLPEPPAATVVYAPTGPFPNSDTLSGQSKKYAIGFVPVSTITVNEITCEYIGTPGPSYHFINTEIWSDSGSLPNAVLVASTPVPESVAVGIITFSFPTPYELIGGTNYWIVTYTTNTTGTGLSVRKNVGPGSGAKNGTLGWVAETNEMSASVAFRGNISPRKVGSPAKTWSELHAGALSVTESTIDATTHQINNVVDPTLPQDAATKNYVDSASSWIKYTLNYTDLLGFVGESDTVLNVGTIPLGYAVTAVCIVVTQEFASPGASSPAHWNVGIGRGDNGDGGGVQATTYLNFTEIGPGTITTPGVFGFGPSGRNSGTSFGLASLTSSIPVAIRAISFTADTFDMLTAGSANILVKMENLNI